jgi:hypothetical protein
LGALAGDACSSGAHAAGAQRRRPIRTIAGEEEFAEVFFDEVEAPAANIVLGVDQGWMLANTLLEAERMDHEFAVRMQGLQNCKLDAVWTTEETGEDPKDRSELMEVFLQKYLTRFLAQAPMSQDDPDRIVQEAVQMHRQFCNGWMVEHQRGLAATIEAAGEARGRRGRRPPQSPPPRTVKQRSEHERRILPSHCRAARGGL